jgi:CspA family cold shock protein
MAKGKVKWFSNKKGYGFITGDNGQEIFVHQTAIKSSGFRTLEQGEQVNFDLIVSDKGPKAENVQRLRL